MNEANDWITSNDTGTSSKTIWAVMNGVVTTKTQCGNRYDTPRDPSDFGRCHRLLLLVPEWRARMGEVAALLPKWTPFVREWEAMTKIYQRGEKEKFSSELYEIMKRLDDEGMLLDGWKKTGPGSWKREDAQVVSFGSGISIRTGK